VDIVQGEQILASKFVSPFEKPGVLPIPRGYQAMTIQADGQAGVGGFVQPGDHVSIIAKLDAGPRSAAINQAYYLVQNVLVLAVGNTIANPNSTSAETKVDTKPSSPTDRVQLTLSVTPSDAERVAFAALAGQLYFTLLPSGQAPVKTTGRSQINIFSRERSVR
jgi:pilus assembly protein CpaB